MSTSLAIGPLGQPPTTTYYYDSGVDGSVVTMDPRPATIRTAAEVVSIVDAIRDFVRRVLTHDPNATVIAPADPLRFSFVVVGGDLEFDFRCPAIGGPASLHGEATQSIATRVTSFEARPERTIAWGNFLLFARWMETIRYMATRPQA